MPKLLIFEPLVAGHHASYLKYLIQSGLTRWRNYETKLVVSQRFLDTHPQIVQMTAELHLDHVSWLVMAPADSGLVEAHNNIVSEAFTLWKLFCKYAESEDADHGLIMEIDKFQFPAALGYSLPCDISGLYFRPQMHYRDINGMKISFKEVVINLRKNILIRRFLKNPALKRLFILDRLAVDHIRKLPFGIKAIPLADPVPVNDYAVSDEAAIDSLREELGIDKHRLVFLQFGVLTPRKGIFQLLDAIQLLPVGASEKICILIVGPASTISIQEQIEAKINEIHTTLPVQIITRFQFILEEDVHQYFRLASVILAPYQRHIGSSAILVRAAAIGKPVLTSNYGAIGEVTRQNQLGIVVDTSVPSEITWGLLSFLEQSTSKRFDLAKARAYAAENSVEHFSQTICENIFDNLM
jgi:glycosyltransferase involved in cell wall biosynthesis